MTNTILNVPRELREILQGLIAIADNKLNGRTGSPNHRHDIPGVWDSDNGELAGKPCAECEIYDAARALLSAPSPAGVDGLEVAAWMMKPDLYEPYIGIRRDSNCRGVTEPLCRLSDAQAIIDGLRGEVAEERAKVAQLEEGVPRIMEASYQFRQQRDQIAGLLREVHDTYRAAIHWKDLRCTMKRIDAALSAGKEGDQ